MNYILECSSLYKNFGSFNALQNVELKLEKGKIIGLLGPNGAGKTTLIKLICGLLTPTSGSVLINGITPGSESKKIISYLPDCDYFPSRSKVSDMIEFFKDFYTDFSEERALMMLQNLGIDKNKAFRSLSKGTRDKVQLILTMSRDAELYILDEPIGGVDPAARDYIINTIMANYRPDSTVLISTHLISEVENVLDEMVFINRGSIMLQKTVDEIREEEHKSVDAYFREVFRDNICF